MSNGSTWGKHLLRTDRGSSRGLARRAGVGLTTVAALQHLPGEPAAWSQWLGPKWNSQPAGF